MRAACAILALALLSGCGERDAEPAAAPPFQEPALVAVPVPGKPDRTERHFVCARLKGKIKLDGKLDERAWREARPVEFVQHWAQAKPAREGRAWMLWDDAYLYLAGEFTDRDLRASVSEHDGDVYLNDVFELFVRPDRGQDDHFELLFAANRATMDLRVLGRDRKAKTDRGWESRLEGAAGLRGTLNDATDEDGGWSAEVRVPWSAFAQTAPAPSAGSVWYFALGRYDYSERDKPNPEISCTAPMRALNFHAFDEYDGLRFEK